MSEVSPGAGSSTSDREAEWPTASWVDAEDEPVAWGWIELPGHLDLLVDPAHLDMATDVLAWFAETAQSPRGGP